MKLAAAELLLIQTGSQFDNYHYITNINWGDDTPEDTNNPLIKLGKNKTIKQHKKILGKEPILFWSKNLKIDLYFFDRYFLNLPLIRFQILVLF